MKMNEKYNENNCKWTLNQVKWDLLPFQSAPKAGEGNAKNRGLKLWCMKIKKMKSKKITNKTLKHQPLWRSLKIKNLE